MVSVRDDPLELVPSCREAWRNRFREERDRVRDVLQRRSLEARVNRIEHVGSTAVPDLAAKDIVDLDVVVADDAVAVVSRALVEDLGGDRVENGDHWHPVFREVGGQRFNDHVFAASSDGWKVSVVTRDVLRTHPVLRAEYEALKRDLAAEHDDLTDYSVGKSEFVARLLDHARVDDGLTFEFTVPG